MNRPLIPARQAHASHGDPWAIANDPTLAPAAKLRRLRQLELDARQALVASEEGMHGPPPRPSLTQILAAIAQVQPAAVGSQSPTKM